MPPQADTLSDKDLRDFCYALRDQLACWRILLAQEMVLGNPALAQSELNSRVSGWAVRAVYLRICEVRRDVARGIPFDPRERVTAAFRLLECCGAGVVASEASAAGLDATRPCDRGHPLREPRIDDGALGGFIDALYSQDFVAAVPRLPATILGGLYEALLEKSIRLDPARRVVIDECPKVRKSKGIFYTPSYIVETIVHQALEPLLRLASPVLLSGVSDPRDIADKDLRIDAPVLQAGEGVPRNCPLMVLDPACGAGAFLVVAYQYLLEWYLECYVCEGAEKHAKARTPRLEEGAGGAWRLTFAERKRILTGHIFGVDLDASAVEVTKLSLLLTLLEGEPSLEHEVGPPKLEGNIQCGNALVGRDFGRHEGPRTRACRDTQPRPRKCGGTQLRPRECGDTQPRPRKCGGTQPRVRKSCDTGLDWDEGFPNAMEAGGFDVVLGNPPYVLLQDERRDDRLLAYFRRNYEVSSYKIDTYHLFIEKGLRLTRPGGYCAMIVPANFLANNYLVPLRRFILREASVERIQVIDACSFRGVGVDTAILLARKTQIKTDSYGIGVGRGSFRVEYVTPENRGLVVQSVGTVSVNRALDDPYVLFRGQSVPGLDGILDRVADRSIVLGELADVNFGKQLRNRKEYRADVVRVSSLQEVETPYRPCYTGRDVSRYRLEWNGLTCLDDELARRGGCWDPSKQNARNKLICRQIGKYPEFAIDPEGFQCLNTVFMVNLRVPMNLREPALSPLALLAVLNSSIVRSAWLSRFCDQRRTFPKIKGTYLKQLPVPCLDPEKSEDRKYLGNFETLGAALVEAHARESNGCNANRASALNRRIETLESRVDQLLLDFYGLAENEQRLLLSLSKDSSDS